MSDHPDVKAETREKVLRAARELGYSPNPLAQAMLSGRTHTLGVVLADVENPFFAEALRAITDTARAAGYDVILANTDEHDAAERTAVQLMLDKRVDGIIISPGNPLEIDHLQRAVDTVPLVLLDRKVPALNVDTVVVDNFSAAFQATQHLTELGHTRIVVASNASRPVDDVPYISSIAERFDGVRAALRAARAASDGERFWIGDWTVPANPQTVERLRAHPPTAILATDSLVALATVAAVRAAGLTVPDDVSIVAFDNSPWSEAYFPALTVVAQPVRELGATATRMLVERIGGLSDPPREAQLPSTLVVRDSTAVSPAAAAPPRR